MSNYSIKDLEKLSGVKAHTLRIWEKRYNLLKPERTESNIRLYSDQELKKLLNVALLYNTGVKISKVASFNKEELSSEVNRIEDVGTSNQKKINELVIASLDYNVQGFGKLIDGYKEELGVESTFKEILIPFLRKVGYLWLTDELLPAQEHLITNLIRQKLLTEIENLPNQDGPKVVLYLPEGEYHELGLLFFHYMYKKKGASVYYLGASVPLSDIKHISTSINPDFILTYAVLKNKKGVEEYLEKLTVFLSNNVHFLENEHQNKLSIKYPEGSIRLKHYYEALDILG